MEFSKLAKVKINGIPACMAEDLSFAINSGDIPVTTLCLGEAGYSNGAHHLEASWRNAIPEPGFENYFPAAAATHQTTTVMFEIAERTITARGRFMTTTISSSTNAANALAVTFRGVILSVA